MKKPTMRIIARSLALLTAICMIAPASAAGEYLWLDTESAVDCAVTVSVSWQGYGDSAGTVEVFLTKGWAGTKMIPSYTAITSRENTVTVTLPALKTGTVLESFYPWAQLLDKRGVPIPSSLDFATPMTARCK